MFTTVFCLYIGSSFTQQSARNSIQSVKRSLIYAKESCQEEDAAARFALHIWPERVEDLPAARRQYGFENRDFALEQFGARFDGKCLAVAPLPGYSIKEIRTGQFIPGEEPLWEGRLTVE